MPDYTALAERLGPALATLIHPGNDEMRGPVPLILPTFQQPTLPEGVSDTDAEELGIPTSKFNQLFLEAVFALIEQAGYSIIETSAVTDLEAAAAAVEPKRHQVIELHCSCGKRIARVAVRDFDTAHPRVNGPEFIRVLGSLSADCSTGHKAAS